MSTMKEVIVHPLPTLTTTIHDVSIPLPSADEVVIKVEAAGSNVKDWSHITSLNLSVNSGDDISGTIHSIGSSVNTHEFKIGDRVAAFHEMLKPHGAYAEYAVAKANTTFHIPEGVSYEEAATVPLVVLTAAITLRRQGYLAPWVTPILEESGNEGRALVVYGASSSLGSFIIKLAKLSNIHPIIAIAGGSGSYISSLLQEEKGDKLFDYRSQTLVSDVRKYLAENNIKAYNGVDAISANKTWVTVSQLLDDGGVLSVVSGANKYDDVDMKEGIEVRYTYVGTAHYGEYKSGMPKQPVPPPSTTTNNDGEKQGWWDVKGDIEFAGNVLRYIGKLMGEKDKENSRKRLFEGHPYEIIPGGLDGVQDGLTRLKEGKARGVKHVYRIRDTEGL